MKMSGTFCVSRWPRKYTLLHDVRLKSSVLKPIGPDKAPPWHAVIGCQVKSLVPTVVGTRAWPAWHFWRAVCALAPSYLIGVIAPGSTRDDAILAGNETKYFSNPAIFMARPIKNRLRAFSSCAPPPNSLLHAYILKYLCLLTLKACGSNVGTG